MNSQPRSCSLIISLVPVLPGFSSRLFVICEIYFVPAYPIFLSLMHGFMCLCQVIKNYYYLNELLIVIYVSYE